MGSQTITRPAEGVVLEFEFPVRSNAARSAALLWIAPDGSEREYAQLRAGAAHEVVHSQCTYEGETWRVRDDARRVLLEYTALRAPIQRLVVRDGSNGAALGGAHGGGDGGSCDAAGASGSADAGPSAVGSLATRADGAGDDDDDDDNELQRALALSLAEWPSAAGAVGFGRATIGPTSNGGAFRTAERVAPPAASPPAPPSVEQLAISLDDAVALSAQLAAQHAARARAQATRAPSPEAEAEARLQCRFPEVDGGGSSSFALRLRESETTQPLLDAILAHAELCGVALGGSGDVRVVSRAPELALVVARSGLVRSAHPCLLYTSPSPRD